jgi:hypothetical protein
MKVELREYDGQFQFRLSAEDVAEAALLVRLGLNSTKQVEKIYTVAAEKEVFSWVSVGKKKNSRYCVD